MGGPDPAIYLWSHTKLEQRVDHKLGSPVLVPLNEAGSIYPPPTDWPTHYVIDIYHFHQV